MKSLERYVWAFIAIALIIMLVLEKCNKGKSDSPGVVSILKEVRVDTIAGKSVDRPVPVPYAIHDTFRIHDTMPGKPYPVEVLKDKLVTASIPMLFFPDTLWLGDKGYVALKDTVQGLIAARSFDWRIFQNNTTIKETTAEKKRLKLFLGLEYTYPSNYLGAGTILQLKNDNLLRVGYGYMDKKSQYSIGYFFKIKLK